MAALAFRCFDVFLLVSLSISLSNNAFSYCIPQMTCPNLYGTIKKLKKYLGKYDLTSFNSMIVDSKYDNDKLKYSSYSMSN